MAKAAKSNQDDGNRAEGSVVSIRLTDSERITYQKAAERCGLSLAAWIRDRLRQAAKREAKES